MKNLVLAAAGWGLLVPHPAASAGSLYCNLWAREVVRVEAQTGSLFDMEIRDSEAAGVVFYQTSDPAMAEATPELLIARAASHQRDCKFLVEFETLPLPLNPHAQNDGWAKAVASLTLSRQGIMPAGENIGDNEWRAACEAEYVSWDPETETVIRKGSPERVRCPCGSEVQCGPD